MWLASFTNSKVAPPTLLELCRRGSLSPHLGQLPGESGSSDLLETLAARTQKGLIGVELHMPQVERNSESPSATVRWFDSPRCTDHPYNTLSTCCI